MDFLMLNNLEPQKEQKHKKNLNKKRIAKTLGIFIIILLVISMIILYINNSSFRLFFDKYIFRKEVFENNLDTISLNEGDNNYSYAFGKNIVVLNANTLDIYNSSGKKEHTLNVDISNPIFDSNNEFLVIAEKNGQKLCLISNNNILWQKSIDGNITNISINKNGYVSVILNDTSYKSLVIAYDTNGVQIFAIHLALPYAVDTSISEDNKYLAIAETNFSGTIIQSNIEIISLDSNLTDSERRKYNYVAETNKMITNIEYQEKNKLVCMYDDSIHIIENDNDTELMKYDYKNILFIDINLSSHIAQIEKLSSGVLNPKSQIKFTNILNSSTSSYEVEGIPKSISSCKDITAINLGTEAVFVKTNGWLSKRYKSNQEIRNIILSNNIAGIVYKNKIEIVKL